MDRSFSFLQVPSAVTARTSPINTKCHWKSNITQSGDISDFLFHFCRRPHPSGLHKWFSDRSSVWKGTMCAGPAFIDDGRRGARWQPVAHYFSLTPDSCWDMHWGAVKTFLLQRPKCWGLLSKWKWCLRLSGHLTCKLTWLCLRVRALAYFSLSALSLSVYIPSSSFCSTPTTHIN